MVDRQIFVQIIFDIIINATDSVKNILKVYSPPQT